MFEIDIVTAFFDIGRGGLPKQKNGKEIPDWFNRSDDKYFEYFKNLAQIKNNLIIYTSHDFKDKVLQIREEAGLLHKTRVVVLDSYFIHEDTSIIDRVKKIANSENFISKLQNPEYIQFWNVDYILVNLFKSLYVNHAIDNKYTESDNVAWIDFGYCRDANTIPDSKLWTYNFDKDKIHIFNLDKIDKDIKIENVVYLSQTFMKGGSIIMHNEKWSIFEEKMFESFNDLLNIGMVDADQTVLLMAYLKDPDLFHLRYINKSDWFRVFKDYNLSK